MISTQVIHFASLIPIEDHIDEGVKSKKIVDLEALNSMIEQQVKKATKCKGKEADAYMIDKAPEGLRGVVSSYIAPNARPYQQQDLIDNTVGPNVITNPLPPHQERNMNAISTMKERVLDFSSPSFPWKAMLQALAQETPLTSVIIEEIIESLVDSGAPALKKGQAMPTIEGFTSLVLALPTIVEPSPGFI
ncbi:hypothetical protein SO802_015171 [Lithocarpus litseifolius]|uniref:Uncharacterized protein n=1 Tax=Lithocarpus litseifolius TaxID=425828 RepID=A0AAW2CX36_9ROSI